MALLQEVPPWWPAALGARLGAEHRTVLTSRNAGLAVRRAIAVRWPDLIKSNGGGANAILARRDRIVADRATRLCWLPERRWAHGVQLASGVWVVNLHATAGNAPAAVARFCARARVRAQLGGGAPLVFGGDLNLRSPSLPGMSLVASRDVDHLFLDGLAAAGAAPRSWTAARCLIIRRWSSPRASYADPVPLTTVIFDLDETLFDHRGAATAGVRAWVAEFGVTPPMTRSSRRGSRWRSSTSGPGIAVSSASRASGANGSARCCPRLGLDAPSDDEGLSQAFAGYLTHYEAGWRRFDDVDGALEQIAARGLSVAMLTNGAEFQQHQKLAATGLSGRVGPVFCCDELGFAKPDLRAYALVCSAARRGTGATCCTSGTATTWTSSPPARRA